LIKLKNGRNPKGKGFNSRTGSSHLSSDQSLGLSLEACWKNDGQEKKTKPKSTESPESA